MSFYNSKSSTAATAGVRSGSLQSDRAVPGEGAGGAGDTISALRWSPASDHLAAASWDGRVRVYDVARADLAARPVAAISAAAPLLTCDWSTDGTLIAGAGADNKVHMLHAATGQTISFAAHDAPVRAVRFVNTSSAPLLASGSWDKTVRYWDPRSDPNAGPVAMLACRDRVYAMDASPATGLLVAATAERHIHLVDLRLLRTQPGSVQRQEPVATVLSALNHQTRAVACYPAGNGWGTVSIEGRCSMRSTSSAISGKPNSEDFTFRCHREEKTPTPGKKLVDIWAVNDLVFHPGPRHESAFATAGSDGTFCFWDRLSRQRLRAFPKLGGAVTAISFNRDGAMFAYAVGYDWAAGCGGNKVDYPLRLALHRVAEEEVAVPRRK